MNNKVSSVLTVSAALLLVTILCNCASTPSVEPVQETPGGDSSISAGTLSASQQTELKRAIGESKKGNFKKGLQLLDRLDKQGNFFSVKANLALASYQLEDYDKAEVYVHEAIALQASDARMYNLAGLVHLASKQFKQAEKSFTRATELNANYALAYYNLALLYDVYYQDIAQAYKMYLTYLNLVNYQDEDTMNWVEQLKYSLEEQ